MNSQFSDKQQLNKTTMNMYATLNPISKTSKKDEHIGWNKSTRYRYSQLNKTAYNPQSTLLASSISRQHKLKISLNLPQIKKDKKFVLDQWLNDSLQGIEKDNSGKIKEPLKTLKKFEMDRGSLINSNLTHDQIQHLYNSLFVFTSGVKNAFQEMFAFSANANKSNHKFEKNYWKMFIILLEHTIPVKLCFQIVEQDYKKQRIQMKNTIQRLKMNKESDQRQLHAKIAKLQKQIEQQQRKMVEQKKQQSILKTTLQLIDESFNEEVGLRLKFQQKINIAYTSYDELKFKYQDIKSELTDKKQQIAQLKQQNKSLSKQLNDLQIKFQYLNSKDIEMQNMIKARQTQLTIKNQQIYDILVINDTVQNKKKAQQAALEELLAQIKHLKKKEQDLQLKVKEKEKDIADKTKLIQKLKLTIQQCRGKNDQIYLKFHDKSIENLRLSQENMKATISLGQHKLKINSLQNQIKKMQDQLDYINDKLSTCQKGLMQANSQIDLKNKNLQNFSNNIAEMKHVKDKFQKLNLTLQIHNQSLHAQLQEVINKSSSFQTQKQELVDKILQLQKTIQKLVIDMAAQKQISENLLSELRKQRKKNGQDINKLNIVINIRNKELRIIEEKNKNLVLDNDKKDVQKMSTINEVTYLHQQKNLLTAQLAQRKQHINTLQKQLSSLKEANKHINIKLQSKQFTINKKKKEIDSQIINLKMALNQYKKRVGVLRQYIHPMIVEDLRQRIVCLNQQIAKILKENQFRNENYEKLVDEIAAKDELIKQKDEMIMNTMREVEVQRQKNGKKQDEVKNVRLIYESKLKQKQDTFEQIKANYLDKQLEYQQIIHTKRSKIQQFISKLSSLTQQLKTQQQINDDLINKKNMIKFQSKEIQTQLQNQQKLKKQLSNNRQQNSSQNQRSITNRSNDTRGREIKYEKIEPKSQIIEVKHNKRQKKSNEGDLVYHEEEQQEDYGRHDKKVEGKQFKTALRLALIRKESSKNS